MAQDNTEKKELTIEQTFSRIDEIAKALEDPGTSLEESFALYQEGSSLLKAANEKIDMVQKQVQILQHTQQSSELTVLDDSVWVE